jgi:RNA polymerase sigma-70 factor (ECF subfamily)
MTTSDAILIDRIRAGDEAGWSELIDRFEGRLLAYVESRLRDRSMAEDIVQETFIGFLNSLPSYDSRRPLEGYLFSIAAHKLTDHLRRLGRRPTVPLWGGSSSDDRPWDLPARQRAASSLLRSGERRDWEDAALATAMAEQIERWRTRGEWLKIQCLELLLVRGWSNKDAAERLGLSEQQVANLKFDFLARLRNQVRKLELPEEVFPELYADA